MTSPFWDRLRKFHELNEKISNMKTLFDGKLPPCPRCRAIERDRETMTTKDCRRCGLYEKEVNRLRLRLCNKRDYSVQEENAKLRAETHYLQSENDTILRENMRLRNGFDDQIMQNTLLNEGLGNSIKALNDEKAELEQENKELKERIAEFIDNGKAPKCMRCLDRGLIPKKLDWSKVAPCPDCSGIPKKEGTED